MTIQVSFELFIICSLHCSHEQSNVHAANKDRPVGLKVVKSDKKPC